MFHIQDSLYLDERELVFTMIRAQGAGGQNVNKVSSAVHLRFDVRASSLPAEVQDALCALNDHRVSKRWRHRHQVTGVPQPGKEPRRGDRAPDRHGARGGAHGKAAPADAATRASQRRRVQRKVLHGEVGGCAAGWAMNEGARLAACGRHRVDEAALARECGEYPHSSRGMSIYRALTIYDSINCNI